MCFFFLFSAFDSFIIVTYYPEEGALPLRAAFVFFFFLSFLAQLDARSYFTTWETIQKRKFLEQKTILVSWRII